MNFGFKFKALHEAVASVEITDVIDSWGPASAKAMRDSLKQAQAQGASTLNVHINSAGGDIIEGLAIFNMLSAFPGVKNVEIGGLAASMASVIAMAGDTITMPKNAWMMIHNPWGVAEGDSDEMQHMADLLDKFRDQLAGIYAARTGQDAKSIIKAMAAETWMTGDEAKALGYCTAVTEPKQIAARFDARRFTHAPKALQRAHPTKGKKMDLSDLLAKLGLPADGTLEDVMNAIGALQDAAIAAKPPGETAEARARREASDATNANGMTAILNELKGMRTELKAVSTRVDGDERRNLIAANARKFTPALEAKALTWPIDVIKGFVETAADVVADDTEPAEDGTRGAPKPSNEIKLSAAQLTLCKQTGRDPVALLAHMKAEAAAGRH